MSQHNRSIELTLAEVIVQADSITPYSRVVTILSQEKLGRHFPTDKIRWTPLLRQHEG